MGAEQKNELFLRQQVRKSDFFRFLNRILLRVKKKKPNVDAI